MIDHQFVKAEVTYHQWLLRKLHQCLFTSRDPSRNNQFPIGLLIIQLTHDMQRSITID